MEYLIVSWFVLMHKEWKHVILQSQGMWLLSAHLTGSKRRNLTILTSHVPLMFALQTTEGKL